jgi:hypothetical protein
MGVDGVMLGVGLAWSSLGTAVHLLVLKYWPTHRHGLRALTMATLFAPGIVGLEAFTPVPASIATAFWATQLPGTVTETAWNAGSWCLVMTVMFVTGKLFFGRRDAKRAATSG